MHSHKSVQDFASGLVDQALTPGSSTQKTFMSYANRLEQTEWNRTEWNKMEIEKRNVNIKNIIIKRIVFPGTVSPICKKNTLMNSKNSDLIASNKTYPHDLVSKQSSIDHPRNKFISTN